MTMAFLAPTVFPLLNLIDRGLVDVKRSDIESFFATLKGMRER
jgi:hypothetical protein